MTLRITIKILLFWEKVNQGNMESSLGSDSKFCLQLLIGRKPKPITIWVDVSNCQPQHGVLEQTALQFPNPEKERKAQVDKHKRSFHQPPRSRRVVFLFSNVDLPWFSNFRSLLFIPYVNPSTLMVGLAITWHSYSIFSMWKGSIYTCAVCDKLVLALPLLR